MAAILSREEQDKKTNIQLAGIAAVLLLFLLLFLLLSQSIIVNDRWVRFLGVLSLLMVFEFINLYLHPLVGTLTHHSPFLMLMTMVAIASLVIPLHHRIEHWVIDKKVTKNKSIRLKMAKNIIAKEKAC